MIFEMRSTPTCVRFAVSTSILCAVLGSSGYALSQQAVSASDTSQGKVALIAQLTAIGWLSGAGNAVLVTGTTSRLPDGESDQRPIRIWASGPSKLRVEIDGPKGMSATTVDGTSGRRHAAGKDISPLPLREQGSVQQWMLPWLLLPRLLANSDLVSTKSGIIDQTPATAYL
jgi:hypothetical protein